MCPKEAKISANMPENFVENFEIWKPKGDTLGRLELPGLPRRKPNS